MGVDCSTQPEVTSTTPHYDPQQDVSSNFNISHKILPKDKIPITIHFLKFLHFSPFSAYKFQSVSNDNHGNNNQGNNTDTTTDSLTNQYSCNKGRQHQKEYLYDRQAEPLVETTYGSKIISSRSDTYCYILCRIVDVLHHFQDEQGGGKFGIIVEDGLGFKHYFDSVEFFITMSHMTDGIAFASSQHPTVGSTIYLYFRPFAHQAMRHIFAVFNHYIPSSIALSTRPQIKDPSITALLPMSSNDTTSTADKRRHLCPFTWHTQSTIFFEKAALYYKQNCMNQTQHNHQQHQQQQYPYVLTLNTPDIIPMNLQQLKNNVICDDSGVLWYNGFIIPPGTLVKFVAWAEHTTRCRKINHVVVHNQKALDKEIKLKEKKDKKEQQKNQEAIIRTLRPTTRRKSNNKRKSSSSKIDNNQQDDQTQEIMTSQQCVNEMDNNDNNNSSNNGDDDVDGCDDDDNIFNPGVESEHVQYCTKIVFFDGTEPSGFTHHIHENCPDIYGILQHIPQPIIPQSSSPSPTSSQQQNTNNNNNNINNINNQTNNYLNDTLQPFIFVEYIVALYPFKQRSYTNEWSVKPIVKRIFPLYSNFPPQEVSLNNTSNLQNPSLSNNNNTISPVSNPNSTTNTKKIVNTPNTQDVYTPQNNIFSTLQHNNGVIYTNSPTYRAKYEYFTGADARFKEDYFLFVEHLEKAYEFAENILADAKDKLKQLEEQYGDALNAEAITDSNNNTNNTTIENIIINNDNNNNINNQSKINTNAMSDDIQDPVTVSTTLMDNNQTNTLNCFDFEKYQFQQKYKQFKQMLELTIKYFKPIRPHHIPTGWKRKAHQMLLDKQNSINNKNIDNNTQQLLTSTTDVNSNQQHDQVRPRVNKRAKSLHHDDGLHKQTSSATHRMTTRRSSTRKFQQPIR